MFALPQAVPGLFPPATSTFSPVSSKKRTSRPSAAAKDKLNSIRQLLLSKITHEDLLSEIKNILFRSRIIPDVVPPIWRKVDESDTGRLNCMRQLLMALREQSDSHLLLGILYVMDTDIFLEYMANL